MATPPPITSVGALDQVGSSFNLARTFGTESFALAFDLVRDLSEYSPEGVSFDTTFTVPDALLSGFDRPDRPADPPDVDFDVTVPDAPTFAPITFPTFGEAPTFDKDAPFLDFTGRPAPFSKTPPTVPELISVEVPDAPTIGLPDLPTFEELNLPDAPNLDDPEFAGVRPVFTAQVPEDGFDYAVTDYTPELLDEVTTEVARMLQGGSGLPPAVEQLIFDRARDREDVNSMQAIDEVYAEFAERGFTFPSGILQKRLDRVRQQNQDNRHNLNRELTIQVHETEIDNLRFAIQQGIAAESLLSQIHFEAEGLKLQTAREVANFAINVFNARVQVFVAEVQAFQADAQVFRDLIEAELAKVERFRAQIEAERVRGEINQQRLELYQAQLQGLNTIIEIYNGQVDAARTKAQINATTLQGFASQIDAFSAEVQAKESEFRAWGQQIQGELGKVDAYRAEAQAFTARTQAYATGVEAKAVAPRLALQEQQVQADAFRAEVAGIQTKIQAEAERARAISNIFSAKANIYASEGQIRAAEAETNTRQFQAKLEESRVLSEAQFREAELNVQQIISLGNQVVQALQGAAQAASQLAASSFSAVQASASISESGIASNTWSESVNYQF